MESHYLNLASQGAEDPDAILILSPLPHSLKTGGTPLSLSQSERLCFLSLLTASPGSSAISKRSLFTQLTPLLHVHTFLSMCQVPSEARR